MTKNIEDITKTISGGELAKFLNIHPADYNVLYPNRKGHRTRLGDKYCPCIDLGINSDMCQGVLTVMDALKIPEIKDFPVKILPVTFGKYKSGDVLVDEGFDIAYLYIGKSFNDEDVVLNLGGDTGERGNIQRGYVNNKEDNTLFCTKRLFPVNIDSRIMAQVYIM